MHRRGEAIFRLVWLAIGVVLGLGWIQVSRPFQPGTAAKGTAPEGMVGFTMELGLVMLSIVWLVGCVSIVVVLITQRRRK